LQKNGLKVANKKVIRKWQSDSREWRFKKERDFAYKRE